MSWTLGEATVSDGITRSDPFILPDAARRKFKELWRAKEIDDDINNMSNTAAISASASISMVVSNVTFVVTRNSSRSSSMSII